MNKIVFLDVDGPMIPRRAYLLPAQKGKGSLKVFDPCATAMLLRLLNDASAKIVISSVWGSQGRDECEALLESNGISKDYLHSDWVTPRKLSSYRINEITWWLEKHHGEYTHYVVLDDEKMDIQNLIRVTTDNGFLWEHFLEARKLLGIEEI